MKILLDTSTFLWLTTDDPQLSPLARGLIVDSENDLFLSSASAWEISVKYSLKKLSLPEPPYKFVPSRRLAYDIQELPIDEESALQEYRLPRVHADPFDRLLICQAIVHGLVLLTDDERIGEYPVRVVW